jgi:hypothetical protein
VGRAAALDRLARQPHGREAGAKEARAFTKCVDFAPSERAFDVAFSE